MLFSQNKFRRFFLISSLVTLIFSGCAAGDGSGDGGGDGGGSTDTNITEDSRTLTTDSNGSVSVNFSLPSTATKFAIDATNSGKFLRFDQLQDSAGVNYLTPGGLPLSFASEFINDINNANVPSRSLDPNIDTSRTFTARITVANNENGGSPISGTNVALKIHSRADNDFGSGTLKVNVFYVGSVGQSAASKNAIDSAFAEFRRIYSNAGLTLSIQQFDISGPDLLPDPFTGSTLYESAGNSASSPAVNLFIAGDIAGEENSVFGIAGGVPCPSFPSVRSALVISILTGAGSDGVYNSLELRLLGESMAHETGHYLGLFHPVEITSGTVDDVDPLSDTPTCSNEDDCINNDSLAANLMFLQPVQDTNGDFIPQNLLTTQQVAVLNRNIAVD